MNPAKWSWNQKVLLSILIILLPLVIVLMFSLQDFVRQTILIPLFYLLWLADILIDSTPQGMFWALLVIIGLIIAIRSLYVTRKPPERVPESETRTIRRQRVGFWILQVHLAREGISRVRFADFFSRLATEVLAFREGVTPSEIEQRFQKGERTMPYEIETFLRLRRMSSTERASLLAWLRELLNEWRNRMSGELYERRPGSKENDLARAIHYLEEELEIKHEV